MKCPTCAIDLLISERHGIEIDYCPQCRGVWLDRGELDKILERSTSELRQSRAEANDDHDDEHSRRGTTHGHGRSAQPYPKKQNSFFSDLFDFG
jgi:Zn-finger nucleic acid-binding protein